MLMLLLHNVVPTHIFLGTIPGPILFGAAFDASCQLQQNLSEGDPGNCYSYDHSHLAYFVLILNVTVKTLSCVFVFLAWWFYKQPNPCGNQSDANDGSSAVSENMDESRQLLIN